MLRRKTLKATGVRLAAALGFHAAARTPHAQVTALIRTLWPVDPGIPLTRIGPANDGGYLVPDDLAGLHYVFSPGVSTESGFEAELAERGLEVFLADYSVDSPAQPHPRFVFDKRFVGAISDERYITLDDWFGAKLGNADAEALLQMDIEGAEYETLLAASPALMRRFRIMVIEFHWLPQLWNAPFFALAERVFAKLRTTHTVVHVHPNNCCGSVTNAAIEIPRIAEFTWLRNDRLRATRHQTRFPHPLDRPNVGKAPLVLPRCWHA